MFDIRRMAVAFVAAILCSLPVGSPASAQCTSALSPPVAAPPAASSLGADDPWPIGLPSWDGRDWSPRYATGRANLSTFVPLVASGVLLRVAEARENEDGLDRPYVVAALVTMGAGFALGPSMGQWCLGPEGRRQSIVPTALRFAGIGQMMLGTHLYGEYLQKQSLAEGLALSLLLPVVLLPGIAAVAYGARLALDRTPRVRCGRDEALQAVSVAPRVDPQTGGHGLSVRIQF